MKRKIIYVDNFLTGHGHTPTTGSTLVKLLKQEGYKVIWTSNKENKLLRLFDMIYTIVKNRQQAVVLIATYSTSAFYFACICGYVCRLFNIPYIPCLHGGSLPERIKKSPSLCKTLFGSSHINIAVSGYLRKSMNENNWKCNEIPNSININNYRFAPRTAIIPALLWVRSFHQIYNPALAIKVVSKLSKSIPGVTLTMVGPDKDGTMDECKKLVKDLELEDKVTFTGLLSTQEWTELAASHDIFINTTSYDNLPVSVVEAMALGMIVITTNVGGIPFLVTDNVNGLLVPPNNETAFADAIKSALDNKTTSSISMAARKKAEQFNWSEVRLLWFNLLDNVAS